MLSTATFDPQHPGSYFIPRANVTPPPSLMHQIWPELDDWKAAYNSNDQKYQGKRFKKTYAMGALLETLEWLREVILQDGVFMKRLFPKHPIFEHPVFNCKTFDRFSEEMDAQTTAMREEPLWEGIIKSQPLVAEKLNHMTHQLAALQKDQQLCEARAIERYHFQIDVLRQIGQQRYTLVPEPLREMGPRTVQHASFHPPSTRSRAPGNTAATTVTPVSPSRPSRTSTAGGASAATAFLHEKASISQVKEGAPQYEFPANVTTVVALQQLWRKGNLLMPSVESLNANYGAKWKPRRKAQTWSVRKRVMDEIVKKAQELGWTEEEVAQDWDAHRDGKSLDGLYKQLVRATKQA